MNVHPEPTAEEMLRDTAIESAKLAARNSMRSDPHVWHEALETALDKVLPGFWDAARRAVVPVQTPPEANPKRTAHFDTYDRPGEFAASPVPSREAIAGAIREMEQRTYMLPDILNVSAHDHAEALRTDILARVLALWGTPTEPEKSLDPQPWLFISDQVFGEFRSDHDKGYHDVSGTYYVFRPRAEYEQDRAKYPTEPTTEQEAR